MLNISSNQRVYYSQEVYFTMKKYPKISYPEDSSGLFAAGSVYIQEKLDGANARFTLESNIEDEYSTESRSLVFGSRNVGFKKQKDETKTFNDSIEYVRENVNLDVLRGYDNKFDGAILFGEYMIPHTLEGVYNWDRWEDKFIGFDVWSIGRNKFIPPHKSVEVFDSIGVPSARILDSYTIEEWENGDTDYHNEQGNWMEDGNWCPKTDFGNGEAEGIVLKNPTTQTYAKMVREDFREKHKTGSIQQERSDATKLSYQYITDARIEKTAHKLVDEGEYDELSMRMMQDLPTEVIQDMAEEEAFNIFMYESWNINLSDFRSVTSDRCSSVLRRMISV